MSNKSDGMRNKRVFAGLCESDTNGDEMVLLIRLINSYLLINDVCVRRAHARMRASVSVCMRSSVCVNTGMLLNVYY